MKDQRRYPRTARLNEVLREVIAEEVERFIDEDDRLELVTITGVEAEADLHHATVYFSSLRDDTTQALEDARVRLQSAIAKQMRIKRTPQLKFLIDPAITEGQRIESIIRDLNENPHG